MTKAIRKIEIVLHIDSTRPSEEIFSTMISFIEKERKEKNTVMTKAAEKRYRA